jgi:8-oxo-dGTP diphosphatase
MAYNNSSNAPRVGIGCIPVHEGRILLVRSHRGLWSTPGGNLAFRESPVEAAIRETREETGVTVFNVEFVAITNDIMEATDTHYVTLWFQGEVEDPAITIHDTDEIAEALWCDPNNLPAPCQVYFENLIKGWTVGRGSSRHMLIPRLR